MKLMHLGKALDAFRRCRNGLAAIEFSFIAPVMIVLFFGVVEGSNALSVSRKVSLSVNTLADLASQESSLTAAQASDLFVGVEQIIGQGNINADVRLVSLIPDPDSADPDNPDIIVHWSRDNSGGTPYAAGSSYTELADATLVDASSSLIVGEIEYTYSSVLTKRIIGPVDFAKMATRWPRRSARVQFCVTAGSCTT